MTYNPYIRRKLDFTFQLGEGSFGLGGGFNKIKLTNKKALVQLENAALPNPNSMVARIEGMTLDQMNQLTVAGLQFQHRNNLVLVEAGDDRSVMTKVFNGQILEAYPDFRGAPATAFTVIASNGAQIQLKPVDPVSFNGSTSVETALKRILEPTGMTLENRGVNVTISNPYFPGTTMAQIKKCLQAADCSGSISVFGDKLTIWPRNGATRDDAMPEISAATGMIGYPEFEVSKIRVRSIFDPVFLARGNGLSFKVKSQFTAANGDWMATNIDLTLTSETVGGPWEMLITGPRNEKSYQTAQSAITSGTNNGLPAGATT